MESGASIPATTEAADGPPETEPAAGVADKLAVASGAIAAGVVIVALVVLFAAVRRGLDLTDESMYIFAGEHPRAFLRASTQFQLLLGPLLSLVGSVWLLRVVKLVGLVAAHACFAWSFVTTAPSLLGAHFRRADRFVIGAAIISAAFGVSVFLPQSPGYNDLSVFILVTAAGLLLLLADKRLAPRADLAAWFAVGGLVWFQLLVKWPSLTAIVPLTALTLLWSGHGIVALLRRTAAVLAGVALGALVTQLFLAPVPDVINGIRQGTTDASTTLDHSGDQLLRQYVTDLSDLARAMSDEFWFLLVAAVATGLAMGVRRIALPVAIAAGGGLAILTPVLILSGRARGGVAPFGSELSQTLARCLIVPFYVSLALLAGVTAFIFRPETRPKLRVLALLLTLVGAPFLSALGTNNPIWFNAALLPAFWVAAALAVASLVHVELGRLLVHGLAFALAAVLAFTAFDGTWRHPYRVPPLATQTVEVELSGVLSGMQVDANTLAFLEQARAAADAVRTRVPPNMLVWSPGVPGASLAGNLDQPLYAWLARQSLAELSLAEACDEHERGILLLQYPNEPANINASPTLTEACAGRTWAQQGFVGAMQVWYAGPRT